MIDKIKSPVTLSGDAELVENLSTSVIINDYKVKMGVNVSRLFNLSGETIGIYKCNDTGYRFFYPFQIAGDGQFYDEILDREDNNYYSTWKSEFEIARGEVIKLGRKDVKVLDVGCGYGAFLNGLKSVEIIGSGLEFNNMAVNHCTKMGFNVSMESIEEHALSHKNEYDVVCAFQVLEHVANVNSFLTACVSSLKPNGKLILGVPNCEPYYAGFHNYATTNIPPHHMGLWNLGAFKKIQSYFNITILSHYYDSKIFLPYYLLFKAKYLIQKFIKEPKIIVFGFSAFLAVFLLPFELLNFRNLYKKVLHERIVVIYEKKH